jgi:hypothetical protein
MLVLNFAKVPGLRMSRQMAHVPSMLAEGSMQA